jgi:hypothetical protein
MKDEKENVNKRMRILTRRMKEMIRMRIITRRMEKDEDRRGG